MDAVFSRIGFSILQELGRFGFFRIWNVDFFQDFLDVGSSGWLDMVFGY